MKILAIDYGEKRIGLATGDSGSKVAFSKGIIENSAQIYKKLNNFCKKESIEKIIVGLPLSLSGEDSAQTKQTREFILCLEQQINIPVELIDERLTSVQAGKMFKDRKPRTRASTVRGRHIDDVAAALLLEQYFRS